jgi:hypothetical protein
VALILQHRSSPVKFLTPPELLTLELMASIERARQAAVAQRMADGCCVECGAPLTPGEVCDDPLCPSKAEQFDQGSDPRR